MSGGDNPLAGAEPTRQIFQGITAAGKAGFYLAAAVAIAIFCYGAWRRISHYRRGRPADRRAVLRAALRSRWASPGGAGPASAAATGPRPVRDIGTGRAVGRARPATWAAHFCIFWGFLAAVMATLILTVDTDVLGPASRAITGHAISFFHGPFFLGYTFVIDTMGFAFLVALCFMAARRGPTRRNPLLLGLLLAILVTAYLLTGLRILSQGMPWFTAFSPFGRAVADALATAGMTSAQAATAHTVLWYLHAALALAFIAWLPFSKAAHMLASPASLLAADRTSSANLPPPPQDRPGYRELSDFTWKQLLELDACTECGRCHEHCPAQTAGAPLSPRQLIMDLRAWAWSAGSTNGRGAAGPAAASQASASKLAGDVISADTLWACTTCMRCVQACPVGVEHVPTIVQLRRSLVDDGVVEAGLGAAFGALARQGNSMGKPARARARWTSGLGFTIKDARKEPVRYLWFVGDYASFDDRAAESTRTLARILHAAGVDFGLLYDSERNAGNDVRRAGEEGLFDLLAEQNIQALRAASFSEIFTTDPHSLNTLRNEYPARGASWPVWHYTELLDSLIADGTISVHPLGERVTYHDPCYLARYNNVIAPPRRLLASLGCELVEMPRHGAEAFCCGAGGGRIWMNDTYPSERPSEIRIREAAGLGVERFVVACPKDLVMFTDAARTTGSVGKLAVTDIATLVERALTPEPKPVGAGQHQGDAP
ncbi:MAG: (Fe-S)-binding protein [Streptosporangiaceae bacterium]